MGGISGLIYSSLPVLVFVPVSSLFGLVPAIVAALGVAALILVWRLVRKESVQPAISGFMGVGICALIAYIVGESKGYFLYGIWMSLFWAVVFLVSVLIRRPVVGYIWSWVNGHDRGWRRRAQGGAGVRHRDDHLGVGVRVAVRRAAPTLRRRRDGLAGHGAHRDGLAADRGGRLATYLAIRSAQRALHAHAPGPGRSGTTLPRPRTRCGKPSWPTPRERTDRPLIAVAILASFVAFLDGSVVNLALPAISRDFGGGLALQQWVVDGYLLALGALILVAGAISEPSDGWSC